MAWYLLNHRDFISAVMYISSSAYRCSQSVKRETREDTEKDNCI